MKKILIKATITALSISLLSGNALAFGARGFAGHANARHFSGGHINRSPNSFKRTDFQGNEGRFTRSSPDIVSARRAAPSQRQTLASNSRAPNVAASNAATHRYTPQTMSVTDNSFANNAVSYHSSKTIHTNSGVSVHTVQNTHRNVVSTQPVLGPRATQPIEVRHTRSSVVVNPVRSPVVVRNPVIVRSPVVINSYHYPYHGGYYYNGYYNYNNVNTFLAVALGVSLFANVAQFAAANNHVNNTVIYPAYYPVDTMSVYAAPVPYASTTFVPYAAPAQSATHSNSSTKSSQPVNVTINNTVNTTTAAPAAATTTTTAPPAATVPDPVQTSVDTTSATASTNNADLTNVATPVTMDNSVAPAGVAPAVNQA